MEWRGKWAITTDCLTSSPDFLLPVLNLVIDSTFSMIVEFEHGFSGFL
jgi:hypothetical protein